MGHLHNVILLSYKKEENFTLCNSMIDLETIMLSEISQLEKVKYHDFTQVWNLMNKLKGK